MELALNTAHQSNDEICFTQLMSKYPKLVRYWNFTDRECDIELIKRELIGMRLGLSEKIMLKFFVMIWIGVDVLNFSMIDALKMLDGEDLHYVLHWVNKPYYP